MFKKILRVLTPIATAINPAIGGVLAGVGSLLTTTKEKTVDKINGKKTAIGFAIGLAAFIAQTLGWDVPIEAQEGVTTSVAAIVQAVGEFIFAIGLVHKIKKATSK